MERPVGLRVVSIKTEGPNEKHWGPSPVIRDQQMTHTKKKKKKTVSFTVSFGKIAVSRMHGNDTCHVDGKKANVLTGKLTQTVAGFS